MLSVNHFLPQILHLSQFGGGQQASQAPATYQSDLRGASQRLNDPNGDRKESTEVEGGLATARDLGGAGFGELMDALSAAIARETYNGGDSVLIALAEAAVLERELSSKFPRRWRIQQSLDALLKMGPNVTTALTAVLEHPSATAHLARIFSG